MLNKVEVTNKQGEILSLPMQEGLDGYVIEDITGLDPVPAVLVSSGFADVDGEQFQASRRAKRNLMIKLGLEAALHRGGTVRDLRNHLYRFLMPKAEAKLRFYDTDGSYVDIVGKVEDFTAPLFTKDPEATAVIVCHQPDFYIPEPVLISAMTTSDATEFFIDYEGTVDTGIILRVNPNRDMSGFTVAHRLSHGTIRTMEFTQPLSAGDQLTISTVSGAKGANLYRAGSDTPILYGVTTQSSWITLEQGANYIRVSAEGEPVPYSIEYTVKIGGL